MILPPIAQVGCCERLLDASTSSSSARVRPRNGPPEAVSDEPLDRARAARRAISWCSAECSESTGISWAPVASASAITSSPPTTSDSLLASATSMPSVSATIVGPSPAEPTMRVEHEVGAGLGDEPHEPLGAGEHLAAGPGLGGARGGVGVGERDPARRRARAPARRARSCERSADSPTSSNSLASAATTSSACVPIEPGGAEDEEPPRHGGQLLRVPDWPACPASRAPSWRRSSARPSSRSTPRS